MTKKEFKHQIALLYLKDWLESIGDAVEVVDYAENEKENMLNEESESIVLDAKDVAECIVKKLLETDPNFFDE